MLSYLPSDEHFDLFIVFSFNVSVTGPLVMSYLM